jgi:hypothetical protein
MFNRLFIKYYADDVELNLGSGGKTIATKDIGGKQHELVLMEFDNGAGGATQVSAANPLPVLASIDTTGLATSAKQDTQITALASILAKIIAAPSTEAKQDALNALVTTLNSIVATAAKQDTGNTSLSKIIAAPATEAKQDTGNT